jgi:hypothetical protein
MARRFLLTDSDAQYEPTRWKRYRDTPESTEPSSPLAQSYLRDVWEKSLEMRQPQNTTAQTTLESRTPAIVSESAANAAITAESNPTPAIAYSADYCPATGYVVAMPNVLRGYQAWLRYPLLHLPLAFYITLLTWKMIDIIRAKKREPQIQYE